MGKILNLKTRPYGAMANLGSREGIKPSRKTKSCRRGGRFSKAEAGTSRDSNNTRERQSSWVSCLFDPRYSYSRTKIFQFLVQLLRN